jgi:RNA polymerase sporulation-specific sigma factor
MYNKVVISGVNTSVLPSIPNDKKKELMQKIKEGDEGAREEFIKGNLRLVLSVIKRFSNRGEVLDDLFQIGCVGLIKAIDNFDLSHNVRFSTYAVPMIIGEIRRHLRDSSTIKVSRSLKDIAYKALSAKEKLVNQLGREPTHIEIAKEIDAKPTDVVAAFEAICDPLSLYDPVFSENGDVIMIMDQISDKENKEEKWISSISITQAIDMLSEKERRILSMRFFQDKTQTEVSVELGISQAQVSRLEKTALISMRKYI